MKSEERFRCEQRWESIGKLERQFIKKPTQTDAIALRDAYQNWTEQGWADIGGYRGFATERALLYTEFIRETKTEGEVVSHVREDSKKYFK